MYLAVLLWTCSHPLWALNFHTSAAYSPPQILKGHTSWFRAICCRLLYLLCWNVSRNVYQGIAKWSPLTSRSQELYIIHISHYIHHVYLWDICRRKWSKTFHHQYWKAFNTDYQYNSSPYWIIDWGATILGSTDKRFSPTGEIRQEYTQLNYLLYLWFLIFKMWKFYSLDSRLIWVQWRKSVYPNFLSTSWIKHVQFIMIKSQ